ncbi:MAG: cysteine desulfurase-like protein [Nitriliruptorales bacterium]|nr:cysteine desulfurase-like protein [Nitriliruptorales bacterium]
MLDVARIRRRFPALAVGGPDGRAAVRADAPGGTQVVDTAIAAMADRLRQGTANQHGPFPTSRETDALCDRVRHQAARFLGSSPEGVVFGQNMTTLTFHVARALEDRFGAGDEIVCTRLDHDANVAPWLGLAERTGATVRWVDMDSDSGLLDLGSLDAAISERTRLVAFPAASNALGTLVDPAPFVAAARAVGALTYLDAVHAAPHVPLDRRAAGVDLLVCSPYKFFGPHAGILAADPDVLAGLRPDRVRPGPDHGPERWQTGTANFEAIAGIGGALSYLEEVGLAAIREHEIALSRRFLDGLDGMGHVRLYGPREPKRRTPTFAVTLEERTPKAVAGELARAGIHVWDGHYYAIEPMRALGLLDRGGAVRIGFAHYHGPEDIDRVLRALADLSPRSAGGGCLEQRDIR